METGFSGTAREERVGISQSLEGMELPEALCALDEPSTQATPTALELSIMDGLFKSHGEHKNYTY